MYVWTELFKSLYRDKLQRSVPIVQLGEGLGPSAILQYGSQFYYNSFGFIAFLQEMVLEFQSDTIRILFISTLLYK